MPKINPAVFWPPLGFRSGENEFDAGPAAKSSRGISSRKRRCSVRHQKHTDITQHGDKECEDRFDRFIC